MAIDLEAWCRREGVTYTEVAERIGASSHARVSLWARGKSFPRSPAVFVAIADMTNGEVTASSMHARFVREQECSRKKKVPVAPRLVAAE